LSDRTFVDLIVIGGGINGVGIARDAAGRGLRVALIEQGDLGAGTSSASTKLIHGGLRYLEHFEFRLVRESLQERERLLALAPHLVRPIEFVLPHIPTLRPRWQIRAGLFLYDRLNGRQRLPASRSLDLTHAPFANVLQPQLRRGFAYSDCRVDDSRLVVLNALDAAARGAQVLTRTRFITARDERGHWVATCEEASTGRRFEISARAVVNAAGPWVERVLQGLPSVSVSTRVRLVKGSHLVVPRLYDDEFAFLFQHPDGRVIFAIPFEEAFTLIGTTDVAFTGDPAEAAIDDEEAQYLCEAVSRYLRTPVTRELVRWTYSGVRPLVDDARNEISQITRDYRLELVRSPCGAPLLVVFGGKLTTYRRLAEHAVDRLQPLFGKPRASWTTNATLPGGDIPQGDFERFVRETLARWPFLPQATCIRLARAYGTRIEQILGASTSRAQLGEHFGGGLTEAEVQYLRAQEWARTADDILWRRTKLGLHLTESERARLVAYLET
jgi:glycerol-3-phosphate dehydrogenase